MADTETRLILPSRSDGGLLRKGLLSIQWLNALFGG